MDFIREQVLKDFEPIIEREIKYRDIEYRLLKLGCESGLSLDDFSIFFGVICRLNEIITDEQERIDLLRVINDSEFLFGENVKYLLRFIGQN